MKAEPWMPDFFIVGAMKSGTTTLHALLAEDPAVFIPGQEVFFFDYDDYFEHPDFHSTPAGTWLDRDFVRDQASARQWYRARFEAAPPGALRGEDSTTYLSSPVAASRIRAALPEARVIVMLRDPASRAYSQHWHHLRTGRAHLDFEGTLRVMPERLLHRSRYLSQVKRYLAAFPREQLHFVVFEEFVRDLAGGLAAARRFLGLPPGAPPAPAASHRNAAQIPRFPRLQLLRNRWLWPLDFARYRARLAGLPPVDLAGEAPGWMKLMDRMHSRLNPAKAGSPPPMSRSTRRFLNALLRRENAGLSELIGVDLDRLWYREG